MDNRTRTLQEAVLYFADPTNCREYLVARRWPKGVTCPRCGSDKVVFLPKYNRWQCSAKHDARQFTAKTGTIMKDSPIGLDKWLMAMWLIVSKTRQKRMRERSNKNVEEISNGGILPS